METQLWAASMNEKWADFLAMRGTEITRLRVSGSKFTLKKKVTKFLEAIAAGQPPADAGAKVVGQIDARHVAQAKLSPGNTSIELKPADPAAKSISFTPNKATADQIWDVIRQSTGKDFEASQVEISGGEAVLPPLFLGAIAGLLWWLLYYTAGQVASGEEIKISGRRQGLQQLVVTIAETLGTTGTLALGVVLLLAIGGWAARRLMVRPLKTVWVPAGTAATA